MPLLDRSLDPIEREVERRVSDALSGEEASADASSGWQRAFDMALELARSAPALAGHSGVTLMKLARNVANDLYLLGPLEDLLADPEVSEIMVNGPHDVRVEVGGRIGRTDYRFRDDDHVMRIIQRICDADNRRCDNTNPMCNCTLHGDRAGAAAESTRSPSPSRSTTTSSRSGSLRTTSSAMTSSSGSGPWTGASGTSSTRSCARA